MRTEGVGERRGKAVGMTSKILVGIWGASAWLSAPAAMQVDFGFAPPEWQTSICLPDDPQKTLVDKSGVLLYHYNEGGREFGARIGVVVADDAVWKRQELLSPRIPIVRTLREAPGLEVVEEAFAVTDLPKTSQPAPLLVRADGGGSQANWAQPAAPAAASLRNIDVHNGGSLRYDVRATEGRIALALCEGWWGEPGKRVQVLRVEGAAPRTVDTVADIGKNKAAAFWFDAKDTDGDGRIAVTVDAADCAGDKNTILNGLWFFPPGEKTDDGALLAGRLDSAAVTHLAVGQGSGPSRNDVILVRVTNKGAEPRTLQPRLVLDTAFDARVKGGAAVLGGGETVFASSAMPDGAISNGQASLGALTLAPGKTSVLFVCHAGGSVIVNSPSSVDEALAAREKAVRYWSGAPLPYGKVEVPDAGVQALFDSSIRNIWQAREIKNGVAVFQVGPTCYRGLWIVDGAFLLESAAILGAGDQARAGVAYELTHQKEDGGIKVMDDFSKENGIVLWTCYRHAQLTQDRAWLESVWPKLTRIAEHIRDLRKQTGANATPLDDGLVPPGFPDGGQGGVHAEYTNPLWNLVGLRAFVSAARWLGKADEAGVWQKEYDDFMGAFRRASARDLRKDAAGNAYLANLMGDAATNDLPQRAQWTFCQAVYPGQLFAHDDPLVAGNLAMLAATEREGMVYGTGWDPQGIWNYFGSFYAHAWLWQGNGRKAADTLYAFANHAAPVLVWREEQSLRGEPFKKVGDMPHNWASAEFIRLTTHLLALDRGADLHLFEGLPAEWVKPNMATRLNGVATPFGKVTASLIVAGDGRSATLRVSPLADPSCRRVVVHTRGWANAQGDGLIELDPQNESIQTVPLSRP